MNTLAYFIYLLITGYITVFVGKFCFRHGRFYLETALDNNILLANKINRLLLTGYYLINLGYAGLMVIRWERISNYAQLFASIASMCGQIIITLAILHYVNLFVILWWQHHIHSNNQNTFQS